MFPRLPAVFAIMIHVLPFRGRCLPAKLQRKTCIGLTLSIPGFNLSSPYAWPPLFDALLLAHDWLEKTLSRGTSGLVGPGLFRGKTASLARLRNSAVTTSIALQGTGLMQTLKVMCISSHRWPFVARIPIALAKVGLQVATIAPARSVIQRITRTHARFICRPWRRSASILRAIDAWSPDLLVCSDDRAVSELHQIHHRACRSPDKARLSRLVVLIEASLGDPGSFAITRTMSAFISSAQAAGIRCPRTVVVGNNEELKRTLNGITYPILLKADGSRGGRGVRLIRGERDILPAICELLLPIWWPAPFKRIITSRLLFWFFCRRPWQRKVCIQEYIVGRSTNRAVFSSQGKVLAGLSVEAVQTLYEFGPTSVVRIIDHPEMKAAAEVMAQRLHLSGFLGFDFIVDGDNKAWLLEMNPRVTPVAHLNVEGANLTTAVFSQLTGSNPTADIPIVREKTIALFPQELKRSSRSEYVWTSHHDVPWEEPEFVRHCLNSALERGWL
jgi:hypothetical protein